MEENIHLLKKRLTAFLANHAIWKRPLRSALSRITKRSWPAVIFGGTLRDLLLFGSSEAPRDVDIVVSGVSFSELEMALHDLVFEKNRFGGLRLRTKGWLIDIWCLNDTWAIRKHLTETSGFDALVRTTFLNVEAVAAEIGCLRGRERRVFYSPAFFDGIEKQTLDINLETNPHPALCVVRTIMTAIRLDFFLSRRLADYVVRQAAETSVSQLLKIQESHYGKLRMREEKIKSVLACLAEQLSDPLLERIKIPATRTEQLDLWEYSDTASYGPPSL